MRIGLRALTLISFMAGLGITGCNVDSNFAGLGKSLLDPDAQGIESPGRLLLEGEHTGLRLVDDNETGDRYLLSRTAQGELSVFNLATQQQCTIPQALGYGALSYEGLPTWIAVIAGLDDGSTELRFSDFDCQMSELRLDYGGRIDDLRSLLFPNVDTPSGVGLLMRLRSRAIVLADPWSGEQRVLEEQADEAPVSVLGRWWWRVDGQLVESDARFQPVRRIGSQVAERTWSSGERQELAYIERGDGGNQLYVARAPDFEPELVEADACGISYAQASTLMYFAPCAERRLTLNDRDAGSVRSVADGVVAAGGPARIVSGQGLLYLTNPDPRATTGTLWLLRDDAEEATAIGENASLGQSRFTPDGGLLALVDASNLGSRLIHWKDGEVLDIAQDVREIGNLGVLANFDGQVGELLQVAPDFSTQVIATGVPASAAVGNALLTQFDGTTGELVLVDQASGALEPIASGVPPRAFLFGQQFEALILLGDRDSTTNTTSLVFHLLETKQSFTVNAGVTEAREVSFPAQGLLYNVLTGDSPGIWFAKVL
jgi:hypothetical protein